jgi:hypothetical protein
VQWAADRSPGWGRYEHDTERYGIKRDTCISITKMIEENSEREAPRESRVILPGQSHISRGMTVLCRLKRGQEREKAREGGRREAWTYSYRCTAVWDVGSRKKVCFGSTPLKRTCWMEVFPLLHEARLRTEIECGG